MIKLKIIILFFIISFSSEFIKAQNLLEIQPLFEYPVAPEDLESLESKCDYLVKNFWNDFDFKKKEPLDQYALNEAFGVYVTSMQYATMKEVDQSIDKLLNKLNGNPLLMLQFTKAAEEKLYGPRADLWNDALYLKFLDAIIKNKKISEQRKSKYINQASALRASAENQSAPSFDFIDQTGSQKIYFPMSTPTMLIFGNPDDDNWRISRLKMESNFKLEEAINKGKINILFIMPDAAEGWQDKVSNYNYKWILGTSDVLEQKYDLRFNPAVFIVGSEGKILSKNLPVDIAVSRILDLIN